jgi:nitronate monooxygenase
MRNEEMIEVIPTRLTRRRWRSRRAVGWRRRYSCRVLRNRFTETWDGREDELRAEGTTVGEEWKAAYAAGDADGSNVVTGEAVGLIKDVRPATDVITQLVAEARALLDARWSYPVSVDTSA